MSTQLSHALERIKVLDVGHEKLEEHIKEVRLEAHKAALERAAKIVREAYLPDSYSMSVLEELADEIIAMKVEK